MKTKQHQAITLILLGKSDRDICQQLEINPKTLWKWKTKNKIFMQKTYTSGKYKFSIISQPFLLYKIFKT